MLVMNFDRLPAASDKGVFWCVGKLWMGQRTKCADICDMGQVTDIYVCAHFLIDVN